MSDAVLKQMEKEPKKWIYKVVIALIVVALHHSFILSSLRQFLTQIMANHFNNNNGNKKHDKNHTYIVILSPADFFI